MLDAESLLAETRRLVEDLVLPHVTAWDRADEVPASVHDRLVDLGLFGALVPVEHGGPGRTVTELVPVWRALSAGWISLTGAVNPSGLGATLLARHGTPAQQQRWLPGLADGQGQAAFSITEPQAGSDLSRLRTVARPLPGGGLEIEGAKRWVAGGTNAAVIFMLVLVEPADRPSCVILPAMGRAGPGWQVDELDKIGYRGVDSATYRFSRFRAHGAEVLGGESGLGQGAPQMLDVLEVGRVNVACRGLGIIDRALHLALTEAREREIGVGVLGDHTHAQLRLGELRSRRAAVEALTDRAAAAVDGRDPEAGNLAMAAKVISSETAVWAVEQASRLAASRSYVASDELARLRRDAPQTQIGEGANDALLMALGGT